MVAVRRRRVRRGIDPRTVARLGATLLREVGCETAELSVLLCDDEFIRELNRRYRGIDQPTDVLSFPVEEKETPEDSPRLLGDVIISLETATRQAEEVSRPLRGEVTWLLVHGLLHLLGHDHDGPTERRRMELETRRLIEILS